MCISGDAATSERSLRDGRPVRLRSVPYEDPEAQRLIELVQQEYVQRYGGRDGAVVDPAEFRAPAGLFLIADVDGEPAGCGAWRVHAPGVVEIKRMYVEPAWRRLGLAALIVDVLEETALAAGHRSAVLNSGVRQPEALALYATLGYEPVPGYGIYAESRGAVFLGKELVREGAPWAS